MLKSSIQVLLRSKIKESISILELRISLNAQTIIPIPSKHVNLNLSSLSKELRIKAILAQNERARIAIEECLEATDKLYFLKACINKSNTELLFELFNDYNNFSRKELERKIFKVGSVLKLHKNARSFNV